MILEIEHLVKRFGGQTVLKDISLSMHPYGLPELIASACVIGLQIWKRSALVSILTGTVVYMLLIQAVF